MCSLCLYSDGGGSASQGISEGQERLRKPGDGGEGQCVLQRPQSGRPLLATFVWTGGDSDVVALMAYVPLAGDVFGLSEA